MGGSSYRRCDQIFNFGSSWEIELFAQNQDAKTCIKQSLSEIWTGGLWKSNFYFNIQK